MCQNLTMNMKFLLPFAILVVTMCVFAEGGKVLIWLPIVSKSVKITYTPVVEELARRGHEVYVAHPFKSKEKAKGITEFQSFDNLEEFLQNMSRFVIVQLNLDNCEKYIHHRSHSKRLISTFFRLVHIILVLRINHLVLF